MEKRSPAVAPTDLSFVSERAAQGVGVSLHARHGVYLALVLLSVAWAWEPLHRVMTMSLKYSNEEYSHIVAIPFITAYLLFVTRDAIVRHARFALLPGVLTLIVGATVSVGARGLTAIKPGTRLSVAILGVVVMWVGAFLLTYGPRALAQTAFPFLLLLFMVPLPPTALDAVILFLQKTSAHAAGVLYALIGMPAYKDGLLFSLPGLTIEVARECSGIRSSLSLLISGLAMAYLLLRKSWTRAAFVLSIVPLAIFKNAVRIVALSWLAIHVDPSFITGSAVHRSSGIPLFVVSLAVLGGFAWLLRKCETSKA